MNPIVDQDDCGGPRPDALSRDGSVAWAKVDAAAAGEGASRQGARTANSDDPTRAR